MRKTLKNNKGITFDTIVKDLLLETGNIEASFSSKMLSTINPNMPIWDQYVLSNLGLKVRGTTKDEKLISTIDTYHKIVELERNLLEREDVKNTISEFKDEYKEYNLSDIKILDYIIWNSRQNDENENI